MADNYRALDALLDHDPMTGVSQTFHMDVDGKMTLRTTQDDTAIRAVCEAERNSHIKNEKIGEFRRVASIPVTVQYDLIRRGIWGNQKQMRWWLGTVEAAPYRTHMMRF